MTTYATKRLPYSWMLLAGIGVFSLGMISGFLRSADDVANGFVYTSIPHIAGRVAGASVAVSPGPVTVKVNTSSDRVVYLWDLTDPVSVYNLLRIGQQTSGVTFTVERQRLGTSVLHELNGAVPSGKQVWKIDQNGNAVSDLDAPVVIPGDTITFSLE